MRLTNRFFFLQGLCDVTPEGYHHLTRLLMNLANGKVVIVLEVIIIIFNHLYCADINKAFSSAHYNV